MPEALLKHASVAIQSIDEYLGPSSQHFFGSGYKRSTYHIQPHMDDDKPLTSADASYPTGWSLKGKESDLQPHLSTVDVMILGVRSTEALLRSVLGLTPNQVELATIQKLVIRAGTRSEESLEGLQLSAEIRNTDTTTNSDDQTADSTVVVQVGVMRVTATARHKAPHAKRPDPPNYSYPIEDSDRHWSASYRYRDQLVEDVVADIETLSAEAEVNVASKLGDLPKTKGSHSQQFMTFIDVFVSLLQFGQVLMYELDGISRDKSETLWMQWLVLRPSSDHEGCTSVIDRVMTTLRITDHQPLTLPNGKWHNAGFAGDSGGIDLSAVFAHRVTQLRGICMRISISGTYSTGKASTAICLSYYTGTPRALVKVIHEIMPDAVPEKRLSEITPTEFLQLMMRRYCDRAVAEAKLGDNCLSNGSLLQGWAHGLARAKYGMNPTDLEHLNEENWPGMNFYREVVDQYERAFKQHVKASYDAIIHLDNERLITNDGHRSMNEEFRVFCNELPWNATSELDIPLYRISGTLTNRMENIVSLLDLPTVTTLDYAIGEMEQEYATIDKHLETERQRISSLTSIGTNR